MSTDTKEKIQQLEKLLLSEDLEELNNATAKFNIFNVLKISNAEIRHSNFLGWLLDPKGTHKLNDYFLKQVLVQAMRYHSDKVSLNTKLTDIVFADFNDAEIKLEKQTNKGRRIDILIDSPTNKLVCIIENKIWSGEGCNQLEDYEKYINNHETYKDYAHKLFVFLTPKENYNCTELYKNYIRMNYREICKVIDLVLKKPMKEDVRYFIQHYKSMLERNIMGNIDKDLIALCRKIYHENKAAIDLINECNDFRAELSDILAIVLKERQDIDTTTIYQENNCTVCLPNGIKDIEKLRFSSFKPDNLIIHLHFVGNFKWRDCLYLEIIVTEASENNPLNSENKNKLLKLLESQLEVKFNGKDDWKYTKNVPILTKDEFYNCDNSDEVMALLSKKLDDIKPKYIDKLREILNEFKP